MKEKNVETSAPKKSKKKLILLLSIIFLLLVSAGVGIAWKSGILTFGGGSDKSTLYWNVAEQTYLTNAGFSARQVEDDGYYHVTLAVDGQQVEYKVKEKALVDDIDNRDIMGLEVDKDGIITAVYDPKEVCDGESISEWYVVSVGEDGFKVRQTKGAESGLSYDVKMTENTGIYDVTGVGKVGATKSLAVNDCVRVFRNYEKEVIYVFVVRGSDYFTGNIVRGYCEHCDAQVDWYEWTEQGKVPVTTRHWRLTNDIILTYQADIKDYQDVVIDLNGYTIESVERRRVFSVGDKASQGTLSIVDQSKEKTGTVNTIGESPHGGIAEIKAGTFNLYSGTIDASKIVASSYGLGVYVTAGSTFNMHGGTIIGGTSVCGRKYNSGFIGGGGGAVYVMGTFNMYDGTIRDGKAVAYQNNTGGYHWGIGGNVDVRNAATFNMEGGEILNGMADRSGGNVYVTANTATFTMRGGVISNGKCITSGGASGNVYVGKSSVFQFEDGLIQKGIVYNGGGGNVGVFGTMIMSGGHITGGLSVAGETFETATKREDVDHHNVYCNSGGVVDISGGTVDGYMRINTPECMVKVSGTARITGADYNLALGIGVEMRIGELTKGAKIGVTGGGFISEKTSSKYLTYIESDYDEVNIQYYKSKLFMGKLGCLCGGSHINCDGKEVVGHYGTCNGTILEWMPWGNKANAPTTSGNWYMVADVQLTAQKGVAVDTKMLLDLNGHTITGKEDTRVYYIAEGRNVQMTILDTSKKQTGKIVSQGEKKLAGSCILVMPGNEVVMYSGTLDASKFKEIGVGGTTLAIRKTSKFTMYGGVLVGGNTTKNGGTVVSEGTIVLYDGIVRDGKAAMAGGNVYVSSGEFRMLGGKIINGSANYYNAEGKEAGAFDKGVGGNLYIKGPNKTTYVNAAIIGGTIEGGQSNGRGGNIHAHQYVNLVLGTEKGEEKNTAVISGGESVSGGNIFARADSTIVIYDGVTIQNGIASNQGGNIFFDSNKQFVIKGGVIENGTAKSAGNIYFSVKAKPMLQGGTIVGGTATTYGGNIFNVGKLHLSGTKIADGMAGARGGNIYTNGDMTMTSGIITGGKAVAEKPTFEFGVGGNICAAGTKKENYVTVTVIGGTIEKGEANGRGGNISAHAYANLVLGTEDATTNDLALITEGKSTGSSGATGGNIIVRGDSTFTMYNGVTVRDGESKYQGGNLSFDSSKTFAMNGGAFEGGTSKDGGSISFSSKLNGTIAGGSISGGTATEKGGNIYNQGTLTVSGGTLSGGTATNGGSIYTSKILNVEGGTISNGFTTEKGGNIYTTGNMTMTGGIITGGKAEAEKPTFEYGIGGNILAAGADKDHYANVTITGGTIEKGEANGRGGNIDAHTYANLVLGKEDATTNDLALITEGKSTGSSGASGGNIFVRGDSTFTMYNGVTVRDGESKYQGGNLSFDSSKTFAMNGGAFEGGTSKDGGSVFFSSKFNGTMAGGSISGGTATEEGGNIFNQGTLTVSGGTITGGTATNGGNIYLYATRSNATKGSGASMTMENATISNGTATLGGNLYIDRGLFQAEDDSYTNTPATMTMNGGTIQGGWATGIKNDGGGNIYLRGQFTMNGGTVKEGAAGTVSMKTGRGGNIFVYRCEDGNGGTAGKVVVNAGSILDGKATDRGGNIMLDHADMEVGTGLITITGGHKVTLNEDGTVNTTGGLTNIAVYGSSSKHFIRVVGVLNAESRIGLSSSNNGKVVEITADTLQAEAVYTSVFALDVSNKKLTLDTTNKILSYVNK